MPGLIVMNRSTTSRSLVVDPLSVVTRCAFDGRQRDLAARVHAPVLAPELAIRAGVGHGKRQPRQALLERGAALGDGALAVERDAIAERAARPRRARARARSGEARAAARCSLVANDRDAARGRRRAARPPPRSRPRSSDRDRRSSTAPAALAPVGARRVVHEAAGAGRIARPGAATTSLRSPRNCCTGTRPRRRRRASRASVSAARSSPAESRPQPPSRAASARMAGQATRHGGHLRTSVAARLVNGSRSPGAPTARSRVCDRPRSAWTASRPLPLEFAGRRCRRARR